MEADEAISIENAARKILGHDWTGGEVSGKRPLSARLESFLPGQKLSPDALQDLIDLIEKAKRLESMPPPVTELG